MNYVWDQLFMFEVSVALLYDIIIEFDLFYIWSSEYMQYVSHLNLINFFLKESSYKVLILLSLWLILIIIDWIEIFINRIKLVLSRVRLDQI